jgi:hypothetical protein
VTDAESFLSTEKQKRRGVHGRPAPWVRIGELAAEDDHCNKLVQTLLLVPRAVNPVAFDVAHLHRLRRKEGARGEGGHREMMAKARKLGKSKNV